MTLSAASLDVDLSLDRAERWRHDAQCANQMGEVDFFPGRGGSAREAKAVCRVCPVRPQCLEYALGFDQLSGVWGGLSERERRQLRRERNAGRRRRSL